MVTIGARLSKVLCSCHSGKKLWRMAGKVVPGLVMSKRLVLETAVATCCVVWLPNKKIASNWDPRSVASVWAMRFRAGFIRTLYFAGGVEGNTCANQVMIGLVLLGSLELLASQAVGPAKLAVNLV